MRCAVRVAIRACAERDKACRVLATRRASIHHDLDAVARLDLGVGVEPVEDAEALGRAVDAGHAVRQRFHGIAGLHVDDLDAQRPRGLDFLQRQPAEGIDGLARVALAFGGLLLGGEDEAVDVAAEAQRIDLELPLVAMGDRGCRREAVDGDVLGRGLVDILPSSRN